MRKEFLAFSPPSLGDEEIAEVVATLQSDWITTGPKTKQFEWAFQKYTHAPGALAVNSCTAALHVALIALGIGPGDEVITTPMTFCASVNVIEQVGATPVLVDIEADTLNIDVKKIEAAMTKRTKAILPVHYAGHPVDLDPLVEMATNARLDIVEDAAHAVSAKYKGRLIGSSENPVAFSFYATKNMTTAEGGMLTGETLFLEHARILSLHGMSKDAWKRYEKSGDWRYEVVEPGFKYNMTDIQASIGLVQLQKLDRFQSRRREIVRRYQEAFSEEEALELPVEREEVEHAWHLYVLRLRVGHLTISRNQFIEKLKQFQIGASVHFIPVHMHPYYYKKYGFAESDYPVTFQAFQRMVSIPLHPGLSDQDVADVIEAVTMIVSMYRK